MFFRFFSLNLSILKIKFSFKFRKIIVKKHAIKKGTYFKKNCSKVAKVFSESYFLGSVF